MNNAINRQKYLIETTLALQRADYEVSRTADENLAVSLNSQSICKVEEIGEITYRQGNLHTGELTAAKDHAYEIVRTTAEYMRAIEAAPPLKVAGLGEGYRLLAEFNGAVLAGHPTEWGVQFITWERDHDRTGVCWGHYLGSDYAAAKQDFAVRAGLIDRNQLFTRQQLTEVYRSIQETLDSGYPITDERRKLLREAADQIEGAVPQLDELVDQSKLKEMEVADIPYQGMTQQF
ncbi:hypothetical protein [uncultured Dysosmobacter sp.]|uniref:hypothetical protein n=1 Tax=uncultured Dysosmobacter sp. TaxID=2591384 RepID=UPI002627985B|nr:hypothetical protein [uncultured Dysosmobacter sp.]